MKDSKPVCSVSLDLDNLWSYMKTHGDQGWKEYPSYLDMVVPQSLALLQSLNLSITFFVVGRDASIASNHAALKMIVDRGHSVGNHSFEHEPWLHLYKLEQIRHEVSRTHDAIRNVTGRAPCGLRGPGFSWSPALLEVLTEMGYDYDASSLPTWLGPLARAYYFWTAKLSVEEKEKRKKLFGTLRDGLQPLKPYRFQLPSGKSIVEIPVTTMPVIRVPFHLSYLLYISRFSFPLMQAYLWLAIGLCRATGTTPSFLLHPLDILGKDQAPQLRFFPGMDLDSIFKERVFRYVMKTLGRHFRLISIEEHARELADAHIRSVPVVVGATHA